MDNLIYTSCVHYKIEDCVNVPVNHVMNKSCSLLYVLREEENLVLVYLYQQLYEKESSVCNVPVL